MTTHHRIISSLAVSVGLALGAGAGPALATTNDLLDNGSFGPEKTTVQSAPVVRVTPGSGGFDWGDASIGAAGGFAITMLGIGSALVVSDRRAHRGGSARA